MLPMNQLAQFGVLLGQGSNFGDEALKQVSVLSGGESGCFFARIMMEKNNVLILDEPTNHMDLEGVEALGDALNKFDGTVVLVSHYRHFVEKVADHILEMTSDGIRDFPGNIMNIWKNLAKIILEERFQFLQKKHALKSLSRNKRN